MTIISQNPYRVLGVYTNSPLRERVGLLNRLNAFAQVGRDVTLPNDFLGIVNDKPKRDVDDIAASNAALSLDKDRLRHSLFWFINGSSIDSIALNYLQSNNIDKAKELFSKKESFSSLINLGILSFIQGDFAQGFSYISKVIHNEQYRLDLIEALGLNNLKVSEDELASMFITDLLSAVPANKLLPAVVNPTDKAIITEKALEEPVSEINNSISVAKSVNSKDAESCLSAGTKLMNSTKSALQLIKDIVGIDDPRYQMVADNLAKQILQCGINYYNNASDDDVDSPRKAMVLQEYALKIAAGQLTKQRCQENYDILKKAVDDMPPAEVFEEVKQLKRLLSDFIKGEDTMSESLKLLSKSRPYLKQIREKLGAKNPFYLNFSTRIANNAMSNVVKAVNEAQENIDTREEYERKTRIAYSDLMSKYGLSSSLFSHSAVDDLLNPTNYNAWVKYHNAQVAHYHSVLREAWAVVQQIDRLDIGGNDASHYKKNRDTLKSLCKSANISTHSYAYKKTMKITLWSLLSIAVIGLIVFGYWAWSEYGFDSLGTASVVLAVISGLVAFGLISASNDNSEFSGKGCLFTLLAIGGAVGFGFLASYLFDLEKARQDRILIEERVQDIDNFISETNGHISLDERFENEPLLVQLQNKLNNSSSSYSYNSKNVELPNDVKQRVNAFIDANVNQLYREAQQTNNITSWEKYVRVVPTEYQKDALAKIDSLKTVGWQTESSAWQMALSENSSISYQKYIDLFPHGAHRSAADDHLIEAEIREINGGEHGTLPEMNRNSYGGSSSTITVKNSTSYTLTLLYSGPTKRRLVLAPHESGHIRLVNGRYQIGARVDASNVQSYSGSENLTGGSYDVEYYISSGYSYGRFRY